jgi:hypothetical protein
MSESAERLPAGEERAGARCGHCHAPLAAEDEAAVCAECGSVHHAACWDRELGCCKPDCINAPLVRLDAPAKGAASAAGARNAAPEENAPRRKKSKRRRPLECVRCGQKLEAGEEVCWSCFAINTPDGLYHGPKNLHKPARDALIMACVGLVICGPILGFLAIKNANTAREQIRKDPRLGGDGLAVAAIAVGVVDILFWAFGIFSRAGGMRP